MRYMIFHTLDDGDPTEWDPSKEDLGQMGALIGEMNDKGVLLAADGLHPSSAGAARIKRSAGETTVTDGPFTEAKEVLGGFVIVSAESVQEATEWAKRYAQILGDANVEVRRVAEAEDFE